MADKLPPSASIAHAHNGAKLVAPSAARNVEALLTLLCEHAPHTGQALEIASGTGQHVSAFAAALPNLHWQPSEIDASRRASINEYIADSGLKNVAPAMNLNAAKPGWGCKNQPNNLILLVNLLHLIPMTDVNTLIAETAQALAPDGTLILYGPFKRNGKLTSQGDIRFDTELRAANSAIGYKDDLDITALLGDVGFSSIQIKDMPANNLAFIARKSA